MSLPWILRLLPYGLVLLAYVAGMFVDVMEIDATQYAVMARDMLRDGDLWHLTDRGQPYLDKPPLIFWLTALSYKLFGVSTFAYKLPSVLFALLAILGTERLTTRFYPPFTAFLAGLILATTQGFFLMNNDVKTDMYLIGAMMPAMWMIVGWWQKGGLWRILLGFFLIGLAVLAKGPLGLVIPALALGGHLLLKREWRQFFRWEYLVGLAVVGLVILPFCLALHEQYGEEGVRFFLWTQSFGRITGESQWNNDASPLYLIHTYAWAFLPWTLLSIAAFIRELYRLWKNKFKVRSDAEGLALAGFVLIFLAFSFSRFKLPHYIFVVFPFAAIFSARLLASLIYSRTWRPSSPIASGYHLFQFILVFGGIIALTIWAFPAAPWWYWTLAGITFVAVVVGYFYSRERVWRHLLPTAIGFSLINLLLNLYLYPVLVQYQSSALAGRYFAAQELTGERLYGYRIGGRALDFYSGAVARNADSVLGPNSTLREAAGDFGPIQEPIYVYTDAEGLIEIQALSPQVNIEILQEFEDFRVARLSLNFLNPETRPDQLRTRYLLKVQAN